MSEPKENRVLGRRGARELAVTELEAVGGAFNTLVCTGQAFLRTVTLHGDGDGCTTTDHD